MINLCQCPKSSGTHSCSYFFKKRMPIKSFHLCLCCFLHLPLSPGETLWAVINSSWMIYYQGLNNSKQSQCAFLTIGFLSVVRLQKTNMNLNIWAGIFDAGCGGITACVQNNGFKASVPFPSNRWDIISKLHSTIKGWSWCVSYSTGISPAWTQFGSPTCMKAWLRNVLKQLKRHC